MVVERPNGAIMPSFICSACGMQYPATEAPPTECQACTGERQFVPVSGQSLQVVPSGHVSFMWSYPNLIPLSAAKVKRIVEMLEPFAFDAVYGAFSGRNQIDKNGKQVVAASAARYIARISEK